MMSGKLFGPTEEVYDRRRGAAGQWKQCAGSPNTCLYDLQSKNRTLLHHDSISIPGSANEWRACMTTKKKNTRTSKEPKKEPAPMIPRAQPRLERTRQAIPQRIQQNRESEKKSMQDRTTSDTSSHQNERDLLRSLLQREYDLST